MRQLYHNTLRECYRLGSKVNLFEPELVAYTTGLTTPLSSGQKTKLNTFIKDLKTGLNINALSDFADKISIRSTETAESSLRNLVKRAHDAIAVNSPTFTPLEGFAGDGVSAYIDENYNPTTDAVNYSLNSVSIGLYLRTENLSENCAEIGARSDAATYTHIYHNGASVKETQRVHQGAGGAIETVLTKTNGMMFLQRISAGTIEFWRNKVKTGTIDTTSSSMPNTNFFTGCRAFNGAVEFPSSKQHSLVLFSRHLAASEITVITDAFEAYMDSNGKGVIA